MGVSVTKLRAAWDALPDEEKARREAAAEESWQGFKDRMTVGVSALSPKFEFVNPLAGFNDRMDAAAGAELRKAARALWEPPVPPVLPRLEPGPEPVVIINFNVFVIEGDKGNE